MIEIPGTGALIHTLLRKIAGAILYIALAPSNFLYLRSYINWQNRYRIVTEALQNQEANK
jgi:hypothetical protein